jgi:ligand-binding SRPBCC domain-containing protein
MYNGGVALTRLVFDSYICAPPASVFAFHERADAFRLLTPWWSGARVIRPAVSLEPGQRALLCLGCGPLAIEWEALHETYEPSTCFVESQVCGPFKFWRHRHLILPAAAGGARLRDELEYELPGGILAPFLDLPVRLFLGRLFAYRHAVTARHVLDGHAVPAVAW